MAEQSRSISLNVLARMDAFNREFRQKFPNATEAAALSATKKMQSVFLREERERIASAKRTAKKIANIQTVVVGGAVAAVGALAARLSFSALKASTQDLMDARNQVNDLGNAVGQSNEQLQAFGFAARLSGGELAELEPSLKAFPKRLDDMARGTGEARAAFERLGLSSEYVSDALNSGTDITAEVIDKLQSMENVTQRAAFATSIFGEKGTRLLQVLGSKGLDEWVELTQRYAIDVGPEAVETSARWEAVSGMLEGKFNQLTEAIFEGMVNSERFTKVAAFAAGAMASLEASMTPVVHILEAFVQNISAAGIATAAFVSGDLQTFSDAVDLLAQDKLVGLGAEIANVWNQGSGTYEQFIADVDAYMASTDRQADALRQTGQQADKAAKAAEAAARARAGALETLRALERQATQDTLDDAQKIERAAEDQFRTITKLIEAGTITAEDAGDARLAIAQRVFRDIEAAEKEAAKAQAEEAQKTADAVNAVTRKITDATATEIDKIRGEWAMLSADITKLARDEAISWEQAQEMKVQATEIAESRIADIVAERNRARLEGVLDATQDYADALGDVFDLVTQRQTEAFSAEGAAHEEHIDKMRNRRQKALEEARNADTEAARSAARLRATELKAQIDQSREERRILKEKHLEAYRASQATAITQTTISGIVAAMQALAQLGPIAGGVAAGAIAITTGASIAAIASEPPPAFFRGGGPIRREGQGEQLALLHDGERVLNARAVRDLGDGVINAINSGFGMQAGNQSPPVILDGEVIADAAARRMRRAGSIRTAAASASNTGRRLVYRG